MEEGDGGGERSKWRRGRSHNHCAVCSQGAIYDVNVHSVYEYKTYNTMVDQIKNFSSLKENSQTVVLLGNV